MSMASRALLIQYSMSTVANYAMGTTLVPAHTLQLLKKANHRFQWGDLLGSSKLLGQRYFNPRTVENWGLKV